MKAWVPLPLGAILGCGLACADHLAPARRGPHLMQVLVAATRDAAFVCGREAELGTLEPGKRADLLVVAGDPLADGLKLDRISAILLDGQPVGPLRP